MIAPCSGHISGGAYQWENYGSEIAPLPDWLAKLLPKKSEKPKAEQPQNGNQPAPKILKGKRHRDALSRAGAMRQKGFTADAIYAALAADNAVRYDPPLAESKLHKLADDLERRYDPAPIEETPGRIPISDTANAERLLAKYSTDLRFTADRRVWVRWTGDFWAVDDVLGALRMQSEANRQIYFEAAAEPNRDLRKALSSWALQSESRYVLESSLAVARFDQRVEVRKFSELFDCQPMLLNVRNGTIDLETGELHAHCRENYLTKMVSIEYDAKAECPKFRSFLGQTFPDPDMQMYLKRFAGLCLTGKTYAQSWWLFYGVTASGKSTLIKILRGILGAYALALPEGYFLVMKNATDFVTANLAGVRLATSIETNEGRTLDVSKVKNLTGEDDINAALKHQNNFEFPAQMKLILATNHRPKIPATDDAIWRRVQVVGFDLTVPEYKRIPDLANILLAEEGAGILRWAVEGCLEWQKLGKLAEPKAVKNAVAEYRSAEDVVGNYVTEHIVRDESTRTSKAEVSKHFAEYCKTNSLRIMSGKRFVAEMQRLGFVNDPLDQKRYWAAIKLEKGW